MTELQDQLSDSARLARLVRVGLFWQPGLPTIPLLDQVWFERVL
ncbi:hypothetical protein [Nocardioides sp. TF02-7]|nr:hypothetical protein [Nocardioides sp. TF02-7]